MSADIMMQNPIMYSDYDLPIVGVNPEEDQRALQIALQLSNLALRGCEDCNSFDDVFNSKKAQNITECVPVPSSEHVAEIVGKQGCKIKALRSKTNTYIKTPVRGDDPVFVVTGRKEDVALARREIQSAAEHFTQIRASRNRHALLASQALGTGNSEQCPGTITLQVRVPYRVVGLVVGPKGATIKRIQMLTHTYIVTPSREKEPVFEVTGLPENVEKAKEEIEAHIATRTGSQQASIDDDFKNNGTEVGSPSTSTDYMEAAISAPFQASSSFPCNVANKSVLRCNAPSFYPTSAAPAGRQNSYDHLLLSNQAQSIEVGDGLPSTDASGYERFRDLFEPPSNAVRRQSSTWSIDDATYQSMLMSSSSRYGGSERGNSLSPTSSISAHYSRMSPTFSEKDFPALPSTPVNSKPLRFPMHRWASEDSTTSSAPLSEAASIWNSSATTPAVNIESGYSSGNTSDSLASCSPTELSTPSTLFDDILEQPQRCVICETSMVAAALVPCGHHLFCLTCAGNIVSKQNALCPCCNLPASMALPIKK